MTTLREAAQQALEALEGWKDDAPSQWTTRDEKTITALRAALAEPVPEPVACQHRDEPRGCYRVRCQLGRKCVEPLYTHPPLRAALEHAVSDERFAALVAEQERNHD